MLFSVILITLAGLAAGAVVNVLADDLPLRRPLRLPRYVSDEKKRSIHLPQSEDDNSTPLALLDDERRPPIAWSGIMAFLSGSRTSPQGVRLSWRYPLAELLTTGLMLTAYFATRDDPEVSSLQLIFWLAYMAILALVTIIDIEHKLILFVVIIPTAALTVLDAILTPSNHGPHLRDALYGGALGFFVFFLLYNGGFLFTYVMGALRGEKIEEIAFGYGDVMLATVSGLMLGWQALIFAMFITVFLGAFGAFIYLTTRSLLGGKYSAFTALPYGPYIVIGTLVMLLFSDQIGKIL